MITFDNFRRLMESNRTVRRFDGSRQVDHATLANLIDLVRFCASGRNLQPLKYRPVTDPAERDALFPLLKWAGYYTDWDGPAEAERPVAYLVQCLDRSLTDNPLCDEGLQLEAITLGARTLGLGCCIIKAFNAPAASAALHLPSHLTPTYIIALGYPAEEVRITPLPASDAASPEAIKYFHDTEGVHTVPKRTLEQLIIK